MEQQPQKQNADTENANTEHPDFTAAVTWAEVKKRNRLGGGHYFSPDTMAGFNSKLHDTPVSGPQGRAYAVVSDRQVPTGRPGDRTTHSRKYQVVRILPGGDVQRPHDPDDPHSGFALRFTDLDPALKARDMLVDANTAGTCFGKEGGPEAPDALPDEPQSKGRVPPEYYRWY